jgi:hypothetical protein
MGSWGNGEQGAGWSEVYLTEGVPECLSEVKRVQITELGRHQGPL